MTTLTATQPMTIAEQNNWPTASELLLIACHNQMPFIIIDEAFDNGIREEAHPMWDEWQAIQASTPDTIMNIITFHPTAPAWRWAWNHLRHELSEYDTLGYTKKGNPSDYQRKLYKEAWATYPELHEAMEDWAACKSETETERELNR